MGPDLIVISWSGGIPSTALVAAVIDGLLPGYVHEAVFIDTGGESLSTLRTIDVWSEFVEYSGLPVTRVYGGKLAEDTLHGGQEGDFVEVPFYTVSSDGKKGRLKRQCTTKYKTRPVRRYYRQRLGLPAVGGCLRDGLVEQWIGYTAEEIGRIRESDVRYVASCYPWMELGWYRNAVEDWLSKFCNKAGLPMPKESACWFCPYRTDWLQLEELDRAVDFDYAIRELTTAGSDAPIFVHKDCAPLSEVVGCGATIPIYEAFAMECDSGYCEL